MKLQAMKQLLSIVLILFAGCTKEEAVVDWPQVYLNNEWVVSEEVTFADTHDPSVIELEDGRRLSVFYDGKSNWKTASEWPVGTKLRLAYSRSEGAMLINAESNFRVVVYDGFEGRHPLDVLSNQNLALDYSNMGMVMAHDASSTRWKQEIQRIHEYFQRSSHLPTEAKAAFAAEQKAWDAFLAAHSQASSSLYSLPDGSMWREISNDAHQQMIRDHALNLLKLLHPVSCADIQNWLSAPDEPEEQQIPEDTAGQKITFSLSQPPVVPISPMPQSVGFLKEFSGTIDGKHQIEMLLQFDGGYQVSGVYYYHRYLKDIYLKGEIVDDGRLLKLIEFDNDGSPAAELSLPLERPSQLIDGMPTFEQDRPLDGTWRSRKNEKSLLISLESQGGFAGKVGDIYGQGNDSAIHAQMMAFWVALKNGDKTKVASCLSYPVRVNSEADQRKHMSKQEFIAEYDNIFTAVFIAKIISHPPRNLWHNYQGIMLAQGSIWFDLEGKVITINK